MEAGSEQGRGGTLVTVTLTFFACCKPSQAASTREHRDGILYSREQILARPACCSCSHPLDGANKGGFLPRLA